MLLIQSWLYASGIFNPCKSTDGNLLCCHLSSRIETFHNIITSFRNLKLKTAVTVGIIGYPNVGKSSLINSLKRSKAVGVGATPGFTKVVQEIQLDKNVKLLDCPGELGHKASLSTTSPISVLHV